MGSGLLKKDNELTLATIEETLSLLFSAIVTGDVSCEIFFFIMFFLVISREVDFLIFFNGPF